MTNHGSVRFGRAKSADRITSVRPLRKVYALVRTETYQARSLSTPQRVVHSRDGARPDLHSSGRCCSDATNTPSSSSGRSDRDVDGTAGCCRTDAVGLAAGSHTDSCSGLRSTIDPVRRGASRGRPRRLGRSVGHGRWLRSDWVRRRHCGSRRGDCAARGRAQDDLRASDCKPSSGSSGKGWTGHRRTCRRSPRLPDGCLRALGTQTRRDLSEPAVAAEGT